MLLLSLPAAVIWQQNHLVLSKVNLRVGKGEFIYLVGRVGSGKSSLIKTINAQIPLKEGVGLVAGYDLSKIRKKQVPYLRVKSAFVFQDFQLLTDRSVNENLNSFLEQQGGKTRQI